MGSKNNLRSVLAEFVLAGFVSGGLAATGAAQATEQGVFDVKLAGVRAAVVQYAANTDGARYAVTGKMRTTGFLSSVVRASYEATARGQQTGPSAYRPSSFVEIRDAGGEVSEAEMLYRAGRPQVKVYDPPREKDRHAVDPASQSGTVDPMTVIFAALRDQPKAQVCNLTLQVFDGKRRSEVVLSDPRASGSEGEITCQGLYRRIAGWSPRKLAERTRFTFEMTYTPRSDGVYQVAQVTTDTTFGRAVLQRR